MDLVHINEYDIQSDSPTQWTSLLRPIGLQDFFDIEKELTAQSSV